MRLELADKQRSVIRVAILGPRNGLKADKYANGNFGKPSRKEGGNARRGINEQCSR